MAHDPLAAADPLFPAIPRAWKFPVASVAELSRQLAAAGPGAELAVLPYVKGGLLYLNLRVLGDHGAAVAEGSTDFEAVASSHDINDSHPCPPFTDCGGG